MLTWKREGHDEKQPGDHQLIQILVLITHFMALGIHLTSLSLCFYICKVGIMIVPGSQSLRIK